MSNSNDSLLVVIIAALYTKKVTSGENRLKSIVRVPFVNGSTAVVMEKRSSIRDFTVIESYFSLV